MNRGGQLNLASCDLLEAKMANGYREVTLGQALQRLDPTLRLSKSDLSVVWLCADVPEQRGDVSLRFFEWYRTRCRSLSCSSQIQLILQAPCARQRDAWTTCVGLQCSKAWKGGNNPTQPPEFFHLPRQRLASCWWSHPPALQCALLGWNSAEAAHGSRSIELVAQDCLCRHSPLHSESWII